MNEKCDAHAKPFGFKRERYRERKKALTSIKHNKKDKQYYEIYFHSYII